MKDVFSFFKGEFKKVVKTIYVDPVEMFIENEQGQKILYENYTSFYIDMIYYLLLSQYFKKVKIKFGGEEKDLRMSFFLILPSRLGKGQLLKIVEESGKNLGLKIKRVSYLNQASLIGSLNESIIKYNIDHNYIQGNPKYRDPRMYGALKDTDILIFPEAKKLVKGMNESETEFILSTLQEALDYPGLINKELKYSDFPISYESTVSILGTTYYITEISELLINQGFFQRIPTHKQDFSIEQIEILRKKIIELYRDRNSNLDFKKQAKFFSEIVKCLKNDEKILKMSDEAVDELQRFNKIFFENIRETSGKQVEILKSFSQTMIEMCVKIAGINCCLREDNEINLNDIGQAISCYNPYLSILINELTITENKKDSNKEIINLILNYYKSYLTENNKFPYKKELITYCKSKGMSIIKTQNMINTMINQNFFSIEKEEHNAHRLKLNVNY